VLHPFHLSFQDKSRSNALVALRVLEVRARDHQDAAEVLAKIKARAHASRDVATS
jgi:hypothetical protein